MSKIRILWECNSLALEHNIFLQISPFLADANSHFYKQGWGLQGRGNWWRESAIFPSLYLRLSRPASFLSSYLLPKGPHGPPPQVSCPIFSSAGERHWWLRSWGTGLQSFKCDLIEGLTQCPWNLGSFLLHFLLLTQAPGTSTPRCKVRGKVTAPSR